MMYQQSDSDDSNDHKSIGDVSTESAEDYEKYKPPALPEHVLNEKAIRISAQKESDGEVNKQTYASALKSNKAIINPEQQNSKEIKENTKKRKRKRKSKTKAVDNSQTKTTNVNKEEKTERNEKESKNSIRVQWKNSKADNYEQQSVATEYTLTINYNADDIQEDMLKQKLEKLAKDYKLHVFVHKKILTSQKNIQKSIKTSGCDLDNNIKVQIFDGYLGVHCSNRDRYAAFIKNYRFEVALNYHLNHNFFNFQLIDSLVKGLIMSEQRLLDKKYGITGNQKSGLCRVNYTNSTVTYTFTKDPRLLPVLAKRIMLLPTKFSPKVPPSYITWDMFEFIFPIANWVHNLEKPMEPLNSFEYLLRSLRLVRKTLISNPFDESNNVELTWFYDEDERINVHLKSVLIENSFDLAKQQISHYVPKNYVYFVPFWKLISLLKEDDMLEKKEDVSLRNEATSELPNCDTDYFLKNENLPGSNNVNKTITNCLPVQIEETLEEFTEQVQDVDKIIQAASGTLKETTYINENNIMLQNSSLAIVEQVKVPVMPTKKEVIKNPKNVQTFRETISEVSYEEQVWIKNAVYVLNLLEIKKKPQEFHKTPLKQFLDNILNVQRIATGFGALLLLYTVVRLSTSPVQSSGNYNGSLGETVDLRIISHFDRMADILF